MSDDDDGLIIDPNAIDEMDEEGEGDDSGEESEEEETL